MNRRRIIDPQATGPRDYVSRQDLDQRLIVLDRQGRITLSLDELRRQLGLEAIAAQAAAAVTVEPTAVDVFAGAGADGLVPDPVSETGLFLKDDGSWAAPGGGGGGAPTTAQYLVGALDGTLSAERLVTDTAEVTWDLATAGQAKANVGAIAESKVTNLVADLAAKVPTSRLISTTAPLQGGGDLTADRTLSLNFAGSSFPGSPADGQVFYRTDLSTLFFWHATYAAWLSVNTYEIDYGWASTVAASSYYYFFQGTGAARYTASNGQFFSFATVVVGITIRPSTPTTGLTAQVRANGANVSNAFVNTTGAGQKNAKENIQTSAVIAADALIAVFNTGASGTGSTSGGGKIRLRRREV